MCCRNVDLPLSDTGKLMICFALLIQCFFSGETLRRRIREQLDAATTLHPVVPAPIERSKSYYRYHILMRTNAIRRLSNTICAILDKLTFPEEVIVSVDVDPQQLT